MNFRMSDLKRTLTDTKKLETIRNMNPLLMNMKEHLEQRRKRDH